MVLLPPLAERLVEGVVIQSSDLIEINRACTRSQLVVRYAWPAGNVHERY